MRRLVIPEVGGNHGFVELVNDNLGNDTILDIVTRSARVSLANDDKVYSLSRNKKLFKYLIKNRHTSPLEHVSFTFHISAPLFVAVHFWRHRTAKVNAISARYTEVEDAFYTPEEFRSQSKDNRQASVPGGIDNQDYLHSVWEVAVKYAYDVYKHLLDKGVAREQARAILPEGRFTRWYWTMDLHNLLHFLSLRLADGAQYETRLYAQAINDILSERDESSWKVIEEVGFEGL